MELNIVTPLYNVEKWIENAIKSVKAQDYKNFRHVIIDDMSTDASAEVIKKTIGADDRFIFIENTEKKFAMGNIFDTLSSLEVADEEIIINLDGDDWLATPRCLSIVNDVYNKTGCVMTFGSYKDYPSGLRGKFSRPLKEDTVKEKRFRDTPWTTSHLRTYKFKLWNKIEKKDLLDEDGQFYKKTCDLALMYPMLEMAGEKVQFIEKILYVYNTANDLNDHKVDHEEQLRIESRIRKQERYKTAYDI